MTNARNPWFLSGDWQPLSDEALDLYACFCARACSKWLEIYKQ